MTGRRRAGAQKEQLRCSHCNTVLRAKDRFCPSCGTPRVAGAAPTPTTATPPLPSPSLQVAGHEDGSLGEQRKVVTVLFADLSGSTVLGERLDPEELRGILSSFFNVLARQIQRYEGTVDKYIGDAIMAVFGAPISHEDDAERAINAALAMQGAIAKLNDDLEARHGVRLGLRIGINTGEVVAGLLAGDVQAAYTVVGDTVNTAQRFEAAAPLGEVLVSAMTRKLAIHSFEFETLEPLVMKNKAKPVEAYRVIGRRYEEIEPEATPFVGRAPQLQLLRGSAVAAVLGRGSVFHLTGEAGIGKSRIVGELRAGLVAGVERLTVHSASFERDSPYALVADILRGAFGIRSADDEASARAALVAGLVTLGPSVEELHIGLLLDVLGYSEQTSFEPEKKRSILLHLLRGVLRAQTDRNPFVITAEDLHWADDASLALVRDLVGDVPGLPCLFITTARPEWTPPWKAQEMRLEPLAGDEARGFVEAAFGVPADPVLVDSILARTGGNPFFIEEVVRSLKASNVLVEVTGRVSLRPDAVAGVPATVQEMLEARIDRLPAGSRGAIGIASVIGRTFWYRVLERLAGGASVKEDVGRLEDERLVTVAAIAPELTYAFRQALIQEVAYQTQLLATRRETHGLVAETIEALFSGRLNEFVDVLAYHYSRSAHAAKAVRWLVRAGDRARRLFANDEALARYAAALARAGDGTGEHDAGTILEHVGDIETLTGRYDAAIATYARARERAGPQPSAVARARLERKVAFTYTRHGNYPKAEELLREALATIGDERDEELAAIWLDLAQAIWRQDRFDDAIAAARRGIAAAEAVGADRYVAQGHRNLGLVYMWKGERGLAAEHLHRALELYRSIDDTIGVMSAHGNLAILYRREGRYEDALAENENALALARRVGDAWVIATVLGNLGEVHRNRRDHERAFASMEASLNAWRSVGDPIGVALMRMNIGILRAEQGESAIARESLFAALAEFERLKSRRFLPELYRTLATLDLTVDPEAASRWAQRSLELAREIKARDDEEAALQLLAEVDAAAR